MSLIKQFAKNALFPLAQCMFHANLINASVLWPISKMLQSVLRVSDDAILFFKSFDKNFWSVSMACVQNLFHCLNKLLFLL